MFEKDLITALKRCVFSLILKGKAKRIEQKEVQVLVYDEEVRTLKRLDNSYGIQTKPSLSDKLSVIAFFKKGIASQGVSLAIQEEKVPDLGLTEGEVAVYNRAGVKVILKANGKLEVSNKTASLAEILDSFISQVMQIQTTGSPVNHALSPTSIQALLQIQIKLKSLLT